MVQDREVTPALTLPVLIHGHDITHTQAWLPTDCIACVAIIFTYVFAGE